MIHICTRGKFNTASRRNANVTVSGNSVFVSENSFKTYANYKNFWIYSNDNGTGNNNTTTNNTNTVNYTRYVATQSLNLNVRSSPNGSVKSSLKKGTQVTVTEISGDWSRISSPTSGWVSSSYLSSIYVNKITGYRTGKYKVTDVSRNSVLCVRRGPSTKYSKKTYRQLSANARNQNRANGNYYANGYKNGVVFTVSRVSGNWGLTPSGWVCLDYCSKI